MPVYELLNRIGLSKSYLFKFQLIAFVGTHLPLLVLIGYLIIASSIASASSLRIIIVILVATLCSTLATLWLHKQLLTPVLSTAVALKQYQIDRTVPELPTEFVDEAGMLMAATQSVVGDLDQLMRARLAFMAAFSHDMRSPLNAILILSDLVEANGSNSNGNSATAKRHAATIRRIAEDQLLLMNNMLELVKAESGTILASPSQTTLACVLESAARTVEPLAVSKNVKFSIELPAQETSEAPIWLDQSKTVQVLNNLILNAIKFVSEQGEVVVKAERCKKEVRFSVRDNGIGISPETYQQLFVPFSPISRKGTANEMGMGLGLWICKIFTEAQGGRIEIKSEVGQGSCFSVIIPQPDLERSDCSTNEPERLTA